MKKSRILLSLMAFLFAIVGAIASASLQDAFYDANGGDPGGGTSGTITSPTSGTCTTTNSGSACLIGSEWAFDTSAHAVTNAGGQSGNPTGLLKRQ